MTLKWCLFAMVATDIDYCVSAMRKAAATEADFVGL